MSAEWTREARRPKHTLQTMANVELLQLAERFEAKAATARKTECSPEFQAYWRGYATALDECAGMIRARSQ